MLTDLKKAPLDEWLEVATDLVEFEHVDSSANLTKVKEEKLLVFGQKQHL